MADESHVQWLKEGVSRWNRRRKKVEFSPNLTGVNFFDLLPTDYRDDPKTSRIFEGIDLSGSDLEDADLSNLNFKKANFQNAVLRSTDLALSNFDKANFSGADLSYAKGANSTFIEANFSEAVLKGIELGSAVLDGAELTERQLTVAQRNEMILLGAKVYPSVEDYQSAIQARSLLKSSSSQDFVSPKSKVDNRSRKNKYDVFYGTNRAPKIERGL